MFLIQVAVPRASSMGKIGRASARAAMLGYRNRDRTEMWRFVASGHFDEIFIASESDRQDQRSCHELPHAQSLKPHPRCRPSVLYWRNGG